MSRIAHPWRLSPALLNREDVPKPMLTPFAEQGRQLGDVAGYSPRLILG